ITGYAAEEVIGKNPRILSSGQQSEGFYHRMWQQINEKGHWQGEIWNRRKNGEIYPELLSVSAIHDERGELINYAGVFSDLTELEQSHRSLERLQRFDLLTDLYNRAAMLELIDEAMDQSRAESSPIAVLLIGLDRFQLVNESFSHQAGDAVLKELARRLKSLAGPHVKVARAGGDQFIVLISHNAKIDKVERLQARLQSRLTRPIKLEQHPPITVQFSTGIVRFPADGTTAEELLRHAETAMFSAKRKSRGRHVWFDSAQTELAQKKLLLEIDLRKALKADQLDVHVQPILRVDDNRIVGAEALARWKHPEHGMIPPDVFIEVAEESGLIGELAMKLLARAARAIVDVQARDDTPLWLAFNISASQLEDRDFVARLLAVLEQAGLSTSRFELELTESMLMQQVGGPSPVLFELEEAGVSISIDDFGTGFSSLAYLQEIKADTLKIDKRFVSDIDLGGANTRIATTIIAMAQALDLEVVAEGVETESQLAMLRKLGCDYYQGYLFSRPLPIDEFTELINREIVQPS
ncbi:MAG: putative bifunctional diguanylate cyclase/phosphodiesterase, partial [Wenzhouxiangellaceae bacterium]